MEGRRRLITPSSTVVGSAATASAFRNGEISVLTAVDILNEGVDILDVNIIVFARVTHQSRIFVQQLAEVFGSKRKTHVECWTSSATSAEWQRS